MKKRYYWKYTCISIKLPLELLRLHPLFCFNSLYNTVMLIFWTMKNWRIKYVRMETKLKKKELLFGPTVLRECFFKIFKWPFKKQRKIRIYGSFLLKNCISILQKNFRRKLRGLLWCIKIGIHCNDYDEKKKKEFHQNTNRLHYGVKIWRRGYRYEGGAYSNSNMTERGLIQCH